MWQLALPYQYSATCRAFVLIFQWKGPMYDEVVNWNFASTKVNSDVSDSAPSILTTHAFHLLRSWSNLMHFEACLVQPSNVWTSRALRGREACDKLDLRNRLSPFWRISELQFAGHWCGSCCGRTSYLQVQWEAMCRQERGLYSFQANSKCTWNRVVHEAQMASYPQQGMWKRPKGLFCCVWWAACPTEAGRSSELLYPLRSAWDPGGPWGSHVLVSIPGGSRANLPVAVAPDSHPQAQIMGLRTSCVTGFPTSVQDAPCSSTTLS